MLNKDSSDRKVSKASHLAIGDMQAQMNQFEMIDIAHEQKLSTYRLIKINQIFPSKQKWLKFYLKTLR